MESLKNAKLVSETGRDGTRYEEIPNPAASANVLRTEWNAAVRRIERFRGKVMQDPYPCLSGPDLDNAMFAKETIGVMHADMQAMLDGTYSEDEAARRIVTLCKERLLSGFESRSGRYSRDAVNQAMRSAYIELIKALDK